MHKYEIVYDKKWQLNICLLFFVTGTGLEPNVKATATKISVDSR
jgi:hypothetical protein